MNKRTEAAARAMSPRAWGPQVWTFAAHGESPTAARARVQQESLEQALVGLTAADAVMFSDEAIEQAAMALNAEHSLAWEILPDWVKSDWRKQVRIMVDALKGDA